MSWVTSLVGTTVLGIFLLAHTVFAVNRAPVWDTAAMNLIKDTFTRQVYENTTENKLLGTLRAVDPEGKTVTYGVDSENTVTVDEFTGQIRLSRKLDREKGDTIVAVTFYAYDPVETGSNIRNKIDYFLRLDVQDVNDNPPVFQNVPYGASIEENMPAFTTIFRQVTVTDADDGYNAEVFVRCDNQESRLGCERFGVSELHQLQPRVYNCSIFTKQSLDYEEQSSYIVTLFAWDNGDPSLNSKVNILVKVIDVQDSPPEFLNTPLNLYTNENVPVGTKIGEIQARDRDQGNPRPIRVVMTSGGTLFELVARSNMNNTQDVFTYDVKTLGALDREQLRGQATFNVMAIELENGVQTTINTTAPVLVNMYDVNDNAPRFDKNEYYINASESVRSTDNTQIPGLTMSVRDQDDASNARFSVRVQSQTFPGAFAVSPTNATSEGPFALAVVNADYMDYEVPAYRNQRVVVVAREYDTSELFSSTATVFVSLLDINDNSPNFTQDSYSVAVNENVGPKDLITITATDADSGNNGKITYSIDTGSQSDSDISQYFEINSNTGAVRLLRPIDYEENREFAVVISASDEGNPKRISKRVLRVIVRNVNDIAPHFLVSSYATRVTETSTQFQPAITVQATDIEEGTANIRYRIIQGNQLPNGPAFAVDPSDGRLSMTRTINYDETPNSQGFFMLVIEATDNGSPPMTSTVNVRINVQDENNFDPRFDRLVYTADVSELASPGTSVRQVRATDQDKGENGQLRYSLQGGLGDFTINTTNGLIRVSPTAQLHSSRPLYRLTVIATDNGSPRQHSSSAVVNVNIMDRNNELPTFSQPLYTATVGENEPLNRRVLTVTATDADKNSSLVYEILKPTIRARTPRGAEFNNPATFNFRESFYIDGDDGEIHIQNKLSFEHVAELDFAVQVRDVWAEQPPIQTATASVNIRILGSVDATPRFVAPWTPEDPTYYFTIPEETAVNTLITTLVANDPIAQNTISRFREIPTVDERNYFTIGNFTGELRVNNRLDYETLRKKVLPVEVEAISNDGQKTAFARIRIQIQDINDNNPTFDQDRYEFELYENRQYPFLVGAVVATDKDSGVFQELTYSLGGQGSENFEILSDGKVIVALDKVINREQKPRYDLTVTATDNPRGITKRQGFAQLVITIQDENDESPRFNLDSYSFLAVDSTAIGTGIGRVEASDLDTGPNSRVIYTMACADSLAGTLFSMNFLTGDVTVDRSLEGMVDGRMATFFCNVTASDQGLPVRSTTVPLRIQITSGSDNGIPLFLWPPPGFTAHNVVENADPGVVVGTVLASSLMGNVTYSFVQNSDLNVQNRFSIDRLTGQITTLTTLDREDQKSYELLINAEVLGNFTLSSVAVLVVEVQDENDNIPKFNGDGCDPELYINPPFKIYPQEDTPVGTTIMSISACDDDDPTKTDTSYKLVTRAIAKYNNSLPVECESDVESPFKLTKLDRTRVSIQVKNPLDHDAARGPIHLLCIEASDANPMKAGRRKRAVYNQHDFTVAYVEVNLVDINDNGPIYPNKSLKIEILEFPQINSVVMAVTANDKDSPPYDEVRYSIQSTKFVGNDGTERNISIAFDINSVTGEVTTKQPRYTQFIFGKFVLVVRAEDNYNNARFDTATLQISVLQVRQRYKVTWTTNSVGNSALKRSVQNDLQEAINGNSWQLTVDELRYHVDNKGVRDTSRLDACFVVVDSNGQSPSKDEVWQAIRSSQTLDTNYDFGQCDAATSAGLGAGATYWWVLVALAIIMFFLTLILIIIVFIMAARLRRKQKSERTTLIQQAQ